MIPSSLFRSALPALVGVVFLGDNARPGLAWLAIVGFLAAVAGAIALARFGEVTDEPALPATRPDEAPV